MKKATLCIVVFVLIFIGCEKNNPPICKIISPDNGSEIMRGELVIFSVYAHDSDGSIQEVIYYNDNLRIAFVEDLPYNFSWDTGDVELGDHVIRVVAIDDKKLEGEASIVIEIIEGPVDEENPVVELIFPVEEATVKGTIDIVVQATDDIGVEYVDFMIKDEDWAVFEKDSTSTSANEYSATIITNNYPDGLIMLSIAAYDAVGNYGKYSFNVYINNSGDTEVPVVEILTPQNNQTVSGHIVFKAKATDNVGVNGVVFSVLDGTWVSIGTDNSAIGDNEYAILWDTRNTLDGTYEISAAAYDAAVNEGYDRISITIDNSGGIEGDGSFIYEGRGYQYKTIGTQTWMIENLAYLPSVSRSLVGSVGSPIYYVYDYQSTNALSAKEKDNYYDYGVLYNWEAAKTACPTGWHLPSDEEWKTLEKYLGMSSSDAGDIGWRNHGFIGMKLKSTSRWTNYGNGENSSGFQAFPGGFRDYDGDFSDLGFYADFWSSSPSGSLDAWGRSLNHDSYGVYRSIYDRSHGFSVRCLQN